MKKIAVIAIALFTLGSVGFAQPGQGGQGGRMSRSATERAQNETLNLVKALSLDVEQTGKILEINKKYAVQDSIRMVEMRNQGGQPDFQALREQMQKNETAKAAEVTALLKPEQIEKFKKYQEERAQRRQGMGGQGRREGGPQGGQGQQ